MKRFIVCAAFLFACGGAPAPTAAAPAATDGEKGTAAGAPDEPQSMQHSAGTSNTTRDIGGARNELDRAEAQIGAATGDCATACRALASMERAANHLCALDSGRECDHARERLAAARERVRTSCGGCAP